jgi:hypothetical protein
MCGAPRLFFPAGAAGCICEMEILCCEGEGGGGARCCRCCVRVWRGSDAARLDGWPLEARYDSDGREQQNGDSEGDQDVMHFRLSLRGHPKLATAGQMLPCHEGGCVYDKRGTRAIFSRFRTCLGLHLQETCSSLLPAVLPHPWNRPAACGRNSKAKRRARQTSGQRPSRDAAGWRRGIAGRRSCPWLPHRA